MHTAPSRREQRGWYVYDWANSAFSTTVATVFLGPYVTSLAKDSTAAGEPVSLLGLAAVTPGAYIAFIIAISVAIQVVIMPIVGALADTARSKRLVLGIAAYAGALTTIGLFFATSYQVAGVLYLLANVAFGCSFVVYNSFLPDIAVPHERNRVSSRGWATGYVGGVLLLVINLGLYLGHDSIGISEGLAVRVSLASAGLWWAIFTIIPLMLLRDRPPAHRPQGSPFVAGFANLGTTLRELPHYPQALLFVIAFFFFNDGIQTVIGLSATFASEELRLGTTIIISAVIVVQVVGIAGALLLGRLAGRMGAKRVVAVTLALWVVMLLIAYVIPAGRATAFLVMAAGIGFVLGGSQALSRSLFAQLIPRDREAEYYSLYEVSGGASSILGPLLFALSLQFLHSYRIAILSLVVFFLIGGALLLRVNVRQGMEQAGTMTADVV